MLRPNPEVWPLFLGVQFETSVVYFLRILESCNISRNRGLITALQPAKEPISPHHCVVYFQQNEGWSLKAGFSTTVATDRLIYLENKFLWSRWQSRTWRMINSHFTCCWTTWERHGTALQRLDWVTKMLFRVPENENVYLSCQNLQLKQGKGADCFRWTSTFKTQSSLGLLC